MINIQQKGLNPVTDFFRLICINNYKARKR